MKVAIIDYGSGNLRSAQKAFERAAKDNNINVSVDLVTDAESLLSADRIVLPGVGAFADCKAGLVAMDGMIEALNEAVMVDGKPFFGICVGTQLMATRGLEKGETEGLGWIEGDVVRMEPQDRSLKIPQIGWNTIHLHGEHPVLSGLETGDDGLHAYFVHSYHLECKNPGDCLAVTHYGMDVTAIVGRENMIGTQFHPEKSQRLGLGLIANFLRWMP